MDNRNTIQDLSRGISERCRTTRKDSDNFVRLFFDLIYEAVLKEKLVKVKGLGTFKLVEVMDRESVNVNTGERFVIPGHSKVSFTPEPALRDRINRPFLNLPTEIINEGTPIELMECMDDDPITVSPHVTPVADVLHDETPAEPAASDLSIEELLSTPSAMVAPEVEPVAEAPLAVQPEVFDEPSIRPIEPEYVPDEPSIRPIEPVTVEPFEHQDTVFEPMAEEHISVVPQVEDAAPVSVQPSNISQRSISTGIVLQPIGTPDESGSAKKDLPFISADSSNPRPKPVPVFRDTSVQSQLANPYADDPLPHMDGIDIIPADLDAATGDSSNPHIPFVPANGPVGEGEFITERTHPDEHSLAHPVERVEGTPEASDVPGATEEPEKEVFEPLPMEDVFDEEFVLQPIAVFGEQPTSELSAIEEPIEQASIEPLPAMDEIQPSASASIFAFDTNPINLDDLPPIGIPDEPVQPVIESVIPEPQEVELPMLTPLDEPASAPELAEIPLGIPETEPDAPLAEIPAVDVEQLYQPIEPLVAEPEPMPEPEPEPELEHSFVEPITPEPEPVLQPFEPIVPEPEPIPQPFEPVATEPEPAPQPIEPVEPEPIFSPLGKNEPAEVKPQPQPVETPKPEVSEAKKGKRDFANEMYFMRLALLGLIAVLLIVVSYFAGNAKLLLDPIPVDPEIPIVRAEASKVDVVASSPVPAPESIIASPFFISGDLTVVQLSEDYTFDDIMHEYYQEYLSERNDVMSSIRQYNQVSDDIVIGAGSRIRLPKLQRRHESPEFNNP